MRLAFGRETSLMFSKRGMRGAAIAGAMVLASCAAGPPPQGLFVDGVAGRTERFELASAEGLELHNVRAVAGALDGRGGVRVEMTPEAIARFQARQQGDALSDYLAVIAGPEFRDGVIEVELAGSAMTDVVESARGFVGIAFRVQDDRKTYDAFYLRPTNGRADDQLRRNHATQYISHPDWTWSRLRTEAPGVYESFVDLVPGEWMRIRIEVLGEKARLFVNGADQPALVVNDLKTGAGMAGAVALWIDVGTQAHFRNLVVTHAGG